MQQTCACKAWYRWRIWGSNCEEMHLPWSQASTSQFIHTTYVCRVVLCQILDANGRHVRWITWRYLTVHCCSTGWILISTSRCCSFGLNESANCRGSASTHLSFLSPKVDALVSWSCTVLCHVFLAIPTIHSEVTPSFISNAFDKQPGKVNRACRRFSMFFVQLLYVVCFIV